MEIKGIYIHEMNDFIAGVIKQGKVSSLLCDKTTHILVVTDGNTSLFAAYDRQGIVQSYGILPRLSSFSCFGQGLIEYDGVIDGLVRELSFSVRVQGVHHIIFTLIDGLEMLLQRRQLVPGTHYIVTLRHSYPMSNVQDCE
jgi:hypothetical protein